MLKTSSGGLVGVQAVIANTRHRLKHFKEMVLTDKRANSSIASDISLVRLSLDFRGIGRGSEIPSALCFHAKDEDRLPVLSSGNAVLGPHGGLFGFELALGSRTGRIFLGQVP